MGQTIDTLYQANFDADSGIGVALSGASPDGWSAADTSPGNQSGELSIQNWTSPVGDQYFQFETGSNQNVTYSCSWSTETVSFAGYTDIKVSVYGSSSTQNNNSPWSAVLSSSDGGLLDNAASVFIPVSGAYATFDYTPNSGLTEGSFTIELSYAWKNHVFRLDDVVITGVVACVDSDEDTVCDDVDGCIDPSACNFLDPLATTCLFEDECGVCGGTGIPLGDCDCDGNQLDALGICGGACTADINANGICDSEESMGCTDPDACNYDGQAVFDNGTCAELDECGVCGGTGIPAGDCDCDGNELDECGVCGGPGIPAGDCDCNGNVADAIGECGGSCAEDLDADGVCDDVDSCVGADADGDGVCDEDEVPGCTDETACNYDALATDDDGSCNQSNWNVSTGGNTLAGGAGYSATFEASALTPVSTIDVTMVANGSSSALAGDLIMLVVDPQGNGAWWGGRNLVYPSDASIIEAGAWPTAWDTGNAVGGSPWTATVDVSAAGLSGTGTWTVLIYNGYSGNGGNATFVGYDVSLVLDNMCTGAMGCTDAAACNYNADAEMDDGSCIVFPAGYPSGCDCSTSQAVNAVLAGGQSSGVMTFDASGSLAFLEVEFAFTASGQSWPSDLLISIAAPNGDCFEFGGFTPTITSGCEDISESVSWPSDWNTGETGTYTAVVSLAGLGASNNGLYGDGTWSFEVINGYSESAGLAYDLNVQFHGLCADGAIMGCTDPAACNTLDVAFIDDGSCLNFVCGECGGVSSNCAGCTEPLACNYDPDAQFDDGSCILPIAVLDTCCVHTENVGEELAGNQSYEWYVEATSVDGLGEFEIEVDFVVDGGSGRNWVSDLVVLFQDPNGNCVWFGGNDFTELPSNWFEYECSQMPGVWPLSWNTTQTGNYTAMVDLDGTGLYGVGTWTIIIQNGDLQTSPAEYNFLEWSVEGLCYVEGCTDAAACNYFPEATVVNNSLCEYPGVCDSCELDAEGELTGVILDGDADDDGICDEDEIAGCQDADACNYDPAATDEDGTCDYCSCPGDNFTSNLAGYGLEIDTVATDIGLISDGLGNTIDLTGYNTYRLYVTMANADDFMNAVSGDANNPTHLSTTTSFYHHPVGGVTPSGVNPLLFGAYPSLVYDSYVTIGLESAPVAGEGTVSTQQTPEFPWTDDFDPGGGLPGGSIVMEDVVGGIWYALTGDANGVAGGDLRVLIAQLTTDGDLSGNLYCQILEHGDGANGTLNPTFSFVPPNACGCTDATACNYDADADHDDGSCYYPDECGVCDGPGAIYECGCADIPEGNCDCNGNVLDECGVCGGTGIPEGDCDCDGNVLDECGVCGGSGIAEGACDCDGNVLDACGVCGGVGVDVDSDGICDDIDNCTDTTSISYADEGNIACLYLGCIEPTADNYDPDPSVIGCLIGGGGNECCIWYGCTDGSFADGSPPACNYDPTATDDDGSCEYLTCAGCSEQQACNYDPAALIDDGSCDYSCQGCTNPCSDNYDPLATVDNGTCTAVLGCMDTLACTFDCSATIPYPAWCDYLDACGVCDGPGAVFECGCEDIPEGDCDCDGNVLDAIGVCGGDCLSDADGDGVCDWPPGCTDATACNYDAEANSDDGSCEWCSCAELTLPDTTDFQSGTLDANTGGYALAGDLSLAFPNITDPDGCFQYRAGTDECGTLSDVSVLEPGEQVLNVTITFNDVSVTTVSTLTVVAPEVVVTCMDRAACNFGGAPPCHYPGEQGDCSAPVDGYAFFKKLNPEGSGCICDSMPGVAIWHENFGAEGAAFSNALVPVTDGLIDSGYGYDGATDTDAVGDNGEWSLDLPADFTGANPNYWGVDNDGTDAYFSGLELNGSELGWTSRAIAMSDEVGTFGKMAAQAHFAGVGLQAGDQVQLNILEGEALVVGNVHGGDEFGETAGSSFTDLVDAPLSVQLEIRAVNDGAGEEWRFDDVTLFGWYQGCTDSRSVDYNANAAFDDGSCTYSWDTCCAMTSGLHSARVWLDTDGVEGAGDELQAVELQLSPSKVVRVEPDVDLILDASGVTGGVLCVKGLDLKPGASVFIPDSVTLELLDPFDAASGNAVRGPGKLKLSGGIDWSNLGAEETVSTMRGIALNAEQPFAVPEGKVLALKGDIDFPSDEVMTLGGKVNLIGEDNRSVRGKSPRFDHLTVELCDTETEVTVEVDTLVVKERLSVKRGTVNMDGHTLEFNSDASGTGLLDAIPAEALLKGGEGNPDVAARIERFIGPDDDGSTLNGFLQFSNAIEAETVGGLLESDDFILQGFAGTNWPGAFSTVQFWDEPNSAYLAPQSLDDPLNVHGGIWLFLAGFQNPTIRVNGTLNDHSLDTSWTFPVTRSATAVNELAGWNFIPNPYQGQLDWQVILDANPFLEDQYAIINTQEEKFEVYGVEALDSLQIEGARYIQPGNAFFVRLDALHSSETMEIPAAAIDNDAASAGFVRSSDDDERILIGVANEHGEQFLMLRPHDEGQLSYTPRRDASFLRTSVVKAGQMAVIADGEFYISKQLPRESRLPLHVVSRGGLETTVRVVKAPDHLCGAIVDTETGATLSLVVGEEMTFVLPEHEADSARFMLELHDFARAEALMPSCPEALDGRIEVHVGTDVTANMSLLDPDGTVLDQLLGVQESATFTAVESGDYSVVVTGVEGTTCPKSQREVSVPPGEQPELLGLDWTVSPCNVQPVDVAFELYGGGTFGWTLIGDEGVVEQGAGSGEVTIAGLAPGEYALDVDHACLQEWVGIDAVDPEAPVMDCAWNEVLVADENGSATLSAQFTGVADAYFWYQNGVIIGQDEPLEMAVTGLGEHDVELLAERGGCLSELVLSFTLVSVERAEEVAPFTVVSEPDGWWRLQCADAWPQLGWRLFDVAGRTISTQQVGEGRTFRVRQPEAAGVYHLHISRPGAAVQVLTLVSAVH